MNTQPLSSSPTFDLAPGALALLGFVRQQPSHGYDIYRQLMQSPELRLIWRVKQSRLYALLARLEEAGLAVGAAVVETHELIDRLRMAAGYVEKESK